MVGQATAWDTADVVVQWLASAERRPLVRGSDARVLPTGHLVYALGNVLYAVPFDPEAMEVVGGPIPLVQGVQRAVRGSGGNGGSANYGISRTGTLVYVPESFRVGQDLRLLSVGRSGNAEALIDEPRNYWRPRISPNGERVLVEVLTGDVGTQIWMVDLRSRTASPFTPRQSAYAVWTPDGASVIYRGARRDKVGLYRRAASGSGTEALLLEWPAASIRPDDVSLAGEVVFSAGVPQDIGVLSPKTGTVTDFATSPAREHMASFSPDGKWLAYTSNESGTDEVYVRPFPGSADTARLVSLGGGSGPRWARDGSALFYRGASGDLMAVATTLAPRFTAGRPTGLFRYAGVYRMSGTAIAYDVHPDGKHFIMVSAAEGSGDAGMRQQVNVVLNWLDEVTQRVAPAR
jgi:serine/threonine-protein kinase